MYVFQVRMISNVTRPTNDIFRFFLMFQLR